MEEDAQFIEEAGRYAEGAEALESIGAEQTKKYSWQLGGLVWTFTPQSAEEDCLSGWRCCYYNQHKLVTVTATLRPKDTPHEALLSAWEHLLHVLSSAETALKDMQDASKKLLPKKSPNVDFILASESLRCNDAPSVSPNPPVNLEEVLNNYIQVSRKLVKKRLEQREVQTNSKKDS